MSWCSGAGDKRGTAAKRWSSAATTIEDVLQHVRPRIQLDDDACEALVARLEETVTEIKSNSDGDFYSMKSLRALRLALVRGLSLLVHSVDISHLDFVLDNPFVALVLEHCESFSEAHTSEEAIKAFSQTLARLLPSASTETRTKLARSVLAHDLPEDISSLKIGSGAEYERALKYMITTAEISFKRAGYLIPWVGDIPLAAFAEALADPVPLHRLRCWTHNTWVQDYGYSTRCSGYFRLNQEKTARYRDIAPVGRHEHSWIFNSVDCMGSDIPIIWGESGSGKTSLALAKAKGLVIHVDLNAKEYAPLSEYCGVSQISHCGIEIAKHIARPILRTLRAEYGAPAGKFPSSDHDQELTIVLDGLGLFPNVMRSLSRHHSFVRDELAVIFGVKRVGLLIVANCSEAVNPAPGSLPNSFSLFEMKPSPRYWARHYEALTSTSSRSLSRALAEAIPPMEEVEKRQPQFPKGQAVPHVRLGPVHALVLRLTANARFAAILADVIKHHEPDDVHCSEQCVAQDPTGALVHLTNVALVRFMEASGVGSGAEDLSLADIAGAAALVVNGATWQRVLADHAQWDKLCRKYGIVTCGMKNDSVYSEATTHTVQSFVGHNWKAGYDRRGLAFLTLPHGMPCVQMSEVFAWLLLWERDLLWLPPAEKVDGFASTVASAAALYCMMPAVNVNDAYNVDATVLTPLRLLLNDLGSAVDTESALSTKEHPIHKVERIVSNEATDVDSWLADIRARVAGGASVVAVNVPLVSQAGVVVCAPRRLVLLHCEGDGARSLTESTVDEVLDSMVPADANTKGAEEGRALTEQLIAACLGADNLEPADKVTKAAAPNETFVVEAAIIFEGPRSGIQQVLLDIAMSAPYSYAGETERTLHYTVQGGRAAMPAPIAVTFRYHVIDVTRHYERALHGLHPVAQRSWWSM